MDFETTPKATLFFFFFYSSSFCRALMRGREGNGNLFSNVLKRILINLVTQTKCFLSPSLRRRRKRGGETVAREREDSLSLRVLAPFLTRARVSSRVSHARTRRCTETAEMRERLLNENFLSTRQIHPNCFI